MSDTVNAGSTPPVFLDAATVRRLTPMPALIAALRRTFAGSAAAPERQHYSIPGDATLLLMPAWQPGVGIGVKVVTVNPHVTPSVQATYLLMDGATGRLRAVIDGAMLTARRTAAASALAADLLARGDTECLLMMGTGNLMPHVVEAHCSVRPIRRVLVWGRDPGHAAAAAAKVRSTEVEAVVVTDRGEALGQADLISCATLSRTPLVNGDRLKAGVHVDLMGAFTPDMCEADPACFARARVFVDTREGALAEAGDLIQALQAGALKSTDIEADLVELCKGRHAGRSGDAEAITLFKSVGTAVEDLAAAQLVFDAWLRETSRA